MNRVTVINPTTEEALNAYEFEGESVLGRKVATANGAFEKWSRFSIEDRARRLRSLADEMEKVEAELSTRITLEMGKPILESHAEVKKCVASLRHFASGLPQHLQTQVLNQEGPKVKVSYQPLGVILGVMPWNFPLWQVIRFAGPALLSGNVVLLKHAPNVWGVADVLEQLFLRSGFEEGIYQNLRIDVPLVSGLVADTRVRGVSLTGSVRAGRALAEVAGRYLKKIVLELGGSDPYVLLDDADVQVAAKACVRARMLNGGQSCIAAKRWIVTPKNRDEFLSQVQALLAGYNMGDPLDEHHQLGPMARADLRSQLDQQVQKGLSEGAELLMGGVTPAMRGYFYPPTLLRKVTPEMTVGREELFGPVATVMEAQNEEQALKWANQTTFGLGAAIFSRDRERAEHLAENSIQSGMCFVNGMCRSDVRWPFGGIKDSGIGRELTHFGLHEFVNIKSVVID